MRVHAFLLILMSTFLLTGCINLQQRVLDDVQLITALGYAELDEDIIEITAVYPDFQPDKSVKSKIFTVQDTMAKEIQNDINLQSEKPYVAGKIEVILYDKNLSERGISKLLDQFIRNPSIGSKIYLGILEGNPKEILSKQYGKIDNGLFLSNLIEQNIETGLLPKTNFHLFNYALYSDGMDAWLPIIKQKEDTVNISGIGLFKDDKLVDTLREDDFFLFKALLEHKSNHETFSIRLPENEELSIFNISSKRKYNISQPMKPSEIIITLKMKAIIREYSDKHLTGNKIHKLEKDVEKYLKETSEEMIRKFQEHHIDPLGMGEQIRSRTRKWDKDKWYELYPNLQVTIKPEVTIIGSGIIE
ncbi:Ger(x)C family spore germination protein [Lederbergia graminis]|uniref:Ger(X)C family spore germination protein n=1 Tax=Lederbergia graminis TaxID=735518 RepID=A0ABW0LF05_9BACI